jgi:hypothetical protein
LDLADYLALLEQQVLQVYRELPVPMDYLALQELMDYLALQVLPEPQVRQVQRVQMEVSLHHNLQFHLLHYFQVQQEAQQCLMLLEVLKLESLMLSEF